MNIPNIGISEEKIMSLFSDGDDSQKVEKMYDFIKERSEEIADKKTDYHALQKENEK